MNKENFIKELSNRKELALQRSLNITKDIEDLQALLSKVLKEKEVLEYAIELLLKHEAPKTEENKIDDSYSGCKNVSGRLWDNWD